MKETGVQVEGIEQIEFQDVHKIDADLLADLDLDRMILIVERNGVDSVKVVDIIKVHIEAAHDHDHLTVDRRATFLGIDNERAIQTLGNMPGEREDMAMIEM